MKEALIPVAEALSRVLAAADEPLSEEWVALEEAHGRTLSRDLVAARTQPPFANSAMDGYAVRASDVAEPPASLKLIGESAAGRAFAGAVGAGETVRIFTGAPMPEGADTIVIQEDVRREGDRVVVEVAARPGDNIRDRRTRLRRRRDAALRRNAPRPPRGRARRRRESSLPARAPPSPGRHSGDRRRTRGAGRAARPLPDRRLQQFLRRGAGRGQRRRSDRSRHSDRPAARARRPSSSQPARPRPTCW